MPVIPSNLLTPCSMKRIICHWSEGNYRANSTDLEHYHILIEGDGTVRGGDHTILDNVSTADGDYAAHTRGTNTGAIGVACCCMVGCGENPFKPGAQPMKRSQWDVMVKVVAELCRFYGIPVTPTTVLGHGEVQKNLGIKQKGKWDPMVWPWDTSKTRAQVGAALREQVAAALAALDGAAPAVPVAVTVHAPAAAGEGESYTLRSALLSSDPTMRRIAETTLVLVPPAHAEPVAGIEAVQEALNRLAASGMAVPRINFGSGDKYRGWFGAQTAEALRVFQRLAGIGVDAKVGDDTLRALDAALVTAGVGGVMPAGSPKSAPSPQPAPVALAVPVSEPVAEFARPAAEAWKGGAGGSSTSGLKGFVYRPGPGVELVIADEELTAKREKKSLGAPRKVRQQRTIDLATGQAVISQSDYCWSERKLPDAVAFANHSGFDGAADLIEGEASYFGKYDPTDEGTGTPVFGIVQTNSSVFGVSLPEPLLIEHGLARREGKYLRKTDKSHTALVEVYYPKKRRLVRVPIVDVGPKASLKRPADLSVAAAAFLQDEPEQKAKGYKLANMQVQMRIV